MGTDFQTLAVDEDDAAADDSDRDLRVAQPSDPGEAGADVEDTRAQAVLAVLGGRAAREVAREWAVEPVLLQRWVRDFVTAGTRQVTNRPAPEAAAQRDRFLAAFAHELRSPLAVAQGWAMMLLEGDVEVEEPGLRRRSAERLHAALATLKDRTLDVELLAAASLGRLRPRPEEVTFADLVSMLPRLEAGTVTGRGLDATLVADPLLLTRVLRDLWSAAWMDPEPTAVEIVVEVVESWLELRVERQGIPIDPRVLRALFEPFDLNDDGTGVTIGLYLARALTVALGGTIGVDQDGDETVLWVRVPRTPSGGGEAS